MYIGVSLSKFDQLVADNRMPQPIQVDRRRLWDLRKLDAAFDHLDGNEADTSWDDFERSAKAQ